MALTSFSYFCRPSLTFRSDIPALVLCAFAQNPSEIFVLSLRCLSAPNSWIAADHFGGASALPQRGLGAPRGLCSPISCCLVVYLRLLWLLVGLVRIVLPGFVSLLSLEIGTAKLVSLSMSSSKLCAGEYEARCSLRDVSDPVPGFVATEVAMGWPYGSA